MINASVYQMGSFFVNSGCTYLFNFVLKSQHFKGNSIRITFPEGYSNEGPSCSVGGLVGMQP